MISSLIPGTVFISNPSHSLNFANRCTNADPNTTEISNSLHMQRTEGEEHERTGGGLQNIVLRSTLIMKVSDRTDTHTVRCKTNFAKDCS